VIVVMRGSRVVLNFILQDEMFSLVLSDNILNLWPQWHVKIKLLIYGGEQLNNNNEDHIKDCDDQQGMELTKDNNFCVK
jgi:hypothetical protein